MQEDINIFDPEKIIIVSFKMMKGQIDCPENFNNSQETSFKLDYGLQLGFNLDDKLVKADFTIEIETISKEKNNTKATGSFQFVFIYHIENLDELAKSGKNNLIDLNPTLANALSSITYSTSRGLLLTKLQGTALQNFILPVINPNSLLHKK